MSFFEILLKVIKSLAETESPETPKKTMPNNEDQRQSEVERFDRLQAAAEQQLEKVTKAYEKHSELLTTASKYIGFGIGVLVACGSFFFWSNMHDMRGDVRETMSEYITTEQRRVDSSLEGLTNRLDADVQAMFQANNIDAAIQLQISNRVKNLTDRLINASIHTTIDPKLNEMQNKESNLNTTLSITLSNVNYLDTSVQSNLTDLTTENDLALKILQASLDDREAFDKLVEMRETLSNKYQPFLRTALNYIIRHDETVEALSYPNVTINWAAFNYSPTNVSLSNCVKLFGQTDPLGQDIILKFIAQQERFSRADKLSVYYQVLSGTPSIQVKTCVCGILNNEMHTSMNLLGTPIFLSWLTNELRNIAITNFTSVLATNKTNEQAYLNRASLNSQATNYVAASNDYESAISLNTKDFEPLNGEAWLLATCPDPSIRNGAKAYELASNACVLTGWTNWYCLGTLAGAYAERGDFTNAAIYQKKSISICNGDDTQKTNGLHYLHLYESNKPSRDPESPAEESKGK